MDVLVVGHGCEEAELARIAWSDVLPCFSEMHKPQRQRLFFIKCPFNFVAEDICITKIFPEILFATLWERPIFLWITHLGYPVNLVLSNRVHFNKIKKSFSWKISKIKIYIPIKFKYLSCPVIGNVWIVGWCAVQKKNSRAIPQRRFGARKIHLLIRSQICDIYQVN